MSGCKHFSVCFIDAYCCRMIAEIDKFCQKKYKASLCFWTHICINHRTSFMNDPIYTLADSGFFKNFLYQGGVKSTVSWVFEDLKFKISEGYNQNWCFPDSAQVVVSV